MHGSPVNSKQVVWHPSLVTREQREAANGHRAAVVWFTGLPGSGKSTTAHEVEHRLVAAGCHAYVIDGDNVRHGLSADLGFSPEDRNEHLRRIAELSRLIFDSGMILLCAFVSPLRANRERVRSLIPADAFFEVYCRCPVTVCAGRDPKGFYARAQAGQIKDYTGVSAPYEEPVTPELLIDTATRPAGQCAQDVIDLLENHGMLGRFAIQASAAKETRS